MRGRKRARGPEVLVPSELLVSWRALTGNVGGLPPWVRGGLVKFAILTVMVSCGKKEPPPSPDRWPPKLVSVKAVDNLHVSCYFSEELDGVSAERRENYAILGPTQSLDVIAASLHRSGVEVNLVTSSQEEVQYAVSVRGVRDLAGNDIKEGSEESFKGSLLPDTLPPTAASGYPKNGDLRIPTDTSLILTFSEPMDTATVSPILLPRDFEFSTSWSASMSRAVIELGSSVEDTLKEDCVYSLLVSSRGKDLGGNRLRSGLNVIFSTGDSLPKGSVSGTVSAQGADPRGAIVLLVAGHIWEESSPFSLTQVGDSSGAYVLSHLPSGPYFVLSAHTVDGRRWIGGYMMGPPDFSPRFIELRADSALEVIDISLFPEDEAAVRAVGRFEQLLNEFLQAE